MASSGLKRPSSYSDPATSKKPRFSTRNPSALVADDDDDRDAVLDADVIGVRGHQHKRNAVKIDGYDSDSDHDNFDRRADEKASREKLAKQKSKAEEDNDMFAQLDDDFKSGGSDDQKAQAKKKKGVRFVDATKLMVDVDGKQVNAEESNSRSGGHVSADFNMNGKARTADVESSSEEEVDEEIRDDIGDVDKELGAGSKKEHAPKLDAFNMREEQEDGAFDDQGNYVRKATDPDAQHDNWLEGTSKKDMRSAAEAHEKRERDRRKRDIEDDAVSTGDVLKTLILLLDRGETVLEALARMGKGKKKGKSKWHTKQKNKKLAANGDSHDSEMAGHDQLEAKRRQDVEAITAAADRLLTKGQAEVYDTERELLVRQYTGETGEQWVEPAAADLEDDLADKSWEYRWIDARDGGSINGPYDGNTMRQWNEAGYFGEGVEFRQAGTNEWTLVANF